jgi:hypothetical protein
LQNESLAAEQEKAELVAAEPAGAEPEATWQEDSELEAAEQDAPEQVAAELEAAELEARGELNSETEGEGPTPASRPPSVRVRERLQRAAQQLAVVGETVLGGVMENPPGEPSPCSDTSRPSGASAANAATQQS